MSSPSSPTAQCEDLPSYPDPEELPQRGYYVPARAPETMDTDMQPQATQDRADLDHNVDHSRERGLNVDPDAVIDPDLSYRHIDISVGAGVNLYYNCRALINAFRRKQSPARYYSAMRICTIVMWEDQDPPPGQPENLKYGVSTFPAGRFDHDGDILQVWTIPNDVISQVYLDDRARIVWHVRAIAHKYADLAYPDFRTALVGVYECDIEGESGLVVAVLMLGNLWCPSFMNTSAIERGMNGLFKHEVESMLAEQFDQPILKSCILDAFAQLE